MKILTLNVCGIRASQKKGLFRWLSEQKFDFINPVLVIGISEACLSTNLIKKNKKSLKSLTCLSREVARKYLFEKVLKYSLIISAL